MAKLLIVLNIFSGVASILGFAYIYLSHGKRPFSKRAFKIVVCISFICCLFTSVFILFFPLKTIEENVDQKITFFSNDNDKDKKHDILFLRGEITLRGDGPHGIEFNEPYKRPPHFEIININGYGKNHVPNVINVTKHQAIIRNKLAYPSDDRPYEFIWVAIGKPLGKL